MCLLLSFYLSCSSSLPVFFVCCHLFCNFNVTILMISLYNTYALCLGLYCVCDAEKISLMVFLCFGLMSCSTSCRDLFLSSSFFFSWLFPHYAIVCSFIFFFPKCNHMITMFFCCKHQAGIQQYEKPRQLTMIVNTIVSPVSEWGLLDP